MKVDIESLIAALREAQRLLLDEGNVSGSDYVASICDSLSLGDFTAISDYEDNVGGMGGIAEFGLSAEYQAVIEEIGRLLEG